MTKNQKTFECNVCLSKFRTLGHLNRTNHWTKSQLTENLPKAKWIDLYMCGKFDDDIGVRNMTKSKVVRYHKTVKKVNNTETKYE